MVRTHWRSSSVRLWISGVAIAMLTPATLADVRRTGPDANLSVQASPPSPSGGGGVTGHSDPADGKSNKDPSAAPPSGPGSDPQSTRRGPGGEADLTPRFRSGDETRYQLAVLSDQETTSDQTPELNTKQQMEQEFTLVLRVKETAGGVTTLELATERVRMKMDGDAGKAAADSGAPTGSAPDETNPHAPPAGQVPTPPGSGSPPGGQAPAPPTPPGQTQEDRDLREMLQTTVKSLAQDKLVVRVDEHGRIMNVSGGNAFGLTGLVPGASGGVGGSGSAAGGGLLGGALEWMIRGSSNQPARARSGATWTNRDALANTPVGGLNLNTKYTVTSVRDGQAQIAFTGSVEPGTGNSQPAISGLRVGVAGYSGTYTWDGVKGQIARLDATMNSSIEGEMLGSAIKSKAQSRMTLERLAPNPR